MLTSNGEDATKNALMRRGSSAKSDRPWDAVRVVASIFAGTILLFTVSGCLATRSWVDNQLNPVKGQLNETNAKLNQTDAKADRALAGLQNLRLERRLVLGMDHGPTFAFGSAALTENAKRTINGFLQDLPGSTKPASASSRVFVVAGYTDSIGSGQYNYQLGLRRAESVAGYLVTREGVDPTQIHVVSYGATKPIANNRTPRGRQSNRRVEILVYQEKIATGS